MDILFKDVRYRKKLILLFLDIASLLLASLLSHAAVLGLRHYALDEWLLRTAFLHFTVLMVLIYPLLLYIFELYNIQPEFKMLSALTYIILSGALAASILFLLKGIFNTYLHSGYVTMAFLIFATALLSIDRYAFFRYLAVPKNGKINVLFVGRDMLTDEITGAMRHSNYQAAGLVSMDDTQIGRHEGGLKVVSTGKNLGNVIMSRKIKVLVVSLKNPMPLEVIKKIYKYKFRGVEVYRSDYFYEILTRKFSIKEYVEDNSNPFPGIGLFAKPVFKNSKKIIDISGALFGLIATTPLLLLTALLVKLTSRGAVFYLQERVGFQERPFKLIKFRTMIADAERPNGPQWAARNDSRVTRIGRFLRKTHLDELPQLINVIKGELSFIGPRPIRSHFVRIIENEIPFYSLRFSVKPGITGWAQVNYDYGGSIEGHIEKYQYDLYYIKHASFFFDLFIILKTIQTLIRKPAY